MAVNNEGMGFIFTLKDRASAGMKRIGSFFKTLTHKITGGAKSMETGLGGLMSQITTMAAGGGILGGAFKAASAAGDFEQIMASVGFITQATTEDMDRLTDAAIKAGLETQFSPTEAALGLRTLGQAGLTAEESITALNASLGLAAASLEELSVEDAAGLAVQAMKTFGISAEETDLAIDKMVRTTNAFKISAGELPLALANASRGALGFNSSLDDTLMFLGLVKNVIPRTESAASGMSRVLERLGNPKRQEKLRKELGISVADAEGNFRNIKEVMAELIDKTKEMSETEQSKIFGEVFGDEGAGGMKVIAKQVLDLMAQSDGQIRTTAEALDVWNQKIVSAEGETDRFTSAVNDTFKGQLVILKGVAQTVMILVGGAFAKVMRPAIEGARDALNRFIEIWRGLPESTKEVIAQVGLFVGIATTAIGALTALRGGMFLFSMATRAASQAAGLLMLKLLPFLAVGALIGGVIYGLAKAFDINFGEILESAQLVWRGLVELIRDGELSNAFVEDVLDSRNLGVIHTIGSIYNGFRSLIDWLKAAWEGFSSTIGGVFQRLEPLWERLREAGARLASTFGGLFDGMGMSGEEFGEMVARGLGKVAEVGGEVLIWVMDMGDQLMKALVPALQDLGEAAEWIWEKITKLAGVIDDWLQNTVAGQAVMDGLNWVMENLGTILGTIVLPLFLMFIAPIVFAALKIGLLIAAIGFLVMGLMSIGEWIGHAIYWLVNELPDALGEAADWVAQKFGEMGDWLGGLWQWAVVDPFNAAMDALADAGAWIQDNVLQPIVKGFEWAFDKIKGAINTILDLARDVINALPDFAKAALPDTVVDFANAGRTVAPGARQSLRSLYGGPAAANTDAAAGGAGTVASFRERKAEIREREGASAERMANAIEKMAAQPFVIRIDGERLGEVAREGERKTADRGFVAL